MPGGYQAIMENARHALAHAHVLASRAIQTHAITAELAVTAEDLRSRARAERERPRRLTQARVDRDLTGLSPVASNLQAASGSQPPPTRAATTKADSAPRGPRSAGRGAGPATGTGLTPGTAKPGTDTVSGFDARHDAGRRDWSRPVLMRKRHEESRPMSPIGKIRGKDSSGRRFGRAEEVEHLVAEIQRSPSPEKTGMIVLDHVGDYDDEFFEALAKLIAREQAHRRLHRVRMLEALREYLRYVRRRAREGHIADMWEELARGAAREQILKGAKDRP